jgi:serine/threonine protein kinase
MNKLLTIDGKFPSYQIIQMLSDSPTSRAFLAERDDKLFVIKEQPKEFCFLKVPQMLCELDCRGLPKIVDFYETDNSFFYTYEYINGVTLTEAYESGLITTGAAVAITEKLCGIVSYLHGKSLLHCDIKPDNILINGNDVFLIDFGIAHIYSKSGGGETAIIGTEGYVTPELGYIKTDFRADVYALGMVLFYLCTGSADIKELGEKVNAKPLRAIISRAANYEVGKRYRMVDRLQNALRRYNKETSYRPFFAVILSACFILCFIAGGLIYPAVEEGVNNILGNDMPQIYEFSDPIIEQAIRLSLGKIYGEPIYSHELLNVQGIYIAGDRAFATWEEQQAYLKPFHESGTKPYFANFVSTDDIAECKNLADLNVQFNSLADISFLSELKKIASIQVDFTMVNDISVIKDLPVLNTFSITDCPVSDLSPIKDCPLLDNISLCHAKADNFDFATPGKHYEYINLLAVNYEKFMPKLSGITVEQLVVNECGIPSFDVFPDVTVTETLDIRNNNLTDTSGAERILADGAEVVV